MKSVRISPGPAAAHAFRLGIIVSAVIGLTGIGLLYWFDAITLAITAFVLVVLFPVYLVLAATVLSRWLGYDKDHTALRPVYRPR